MHIRSLLCTGFAAAFLGMSIGAATSAFARDTSDGGKTWETNWYADFKKAACPGGITGAGD